MLFDLLFIMSLFLFFNSWILFFIFSISFKLFRYVDSQVNNVISGDSFISNNVDAEEDTPYKYNSLDDSFKAFDECGYNDRLLMNMPYKFIKKYISHPLEIVYSNSQIVFVPQIYEKLDKELKKRCIKTLVYIWNLKCSNRLKMKMSAYIMKLYMQQMMQQSRRQE